LEKVLDKFPAEAPVGLFMNCVKKAITELSKNNSQDEQVMTVRFFDPN
jgi:hypothetical protein